MDSGCEDIKKLASGESKLAPLLDRSWLALSKIPIITKKKKKKLFSQVMNLKILLLSQGLE
jgi:hypothetical protein